MPYGYDKPITSFGREFITTANPSKNFIKRVERNLPVNSNDSSIALKLYNNLNSCLVYNEEFVAFNQDISIDFMSKIYNKQLNEFNMQDNDAICKSWAELFSYFLTRHNIKNVINDMSFHRYVIFKADGYVYKADATELKESYTKMDDLTRAKLQLKPEGLTALIQTANGVEYVNIYDLGLPLDESVEVTFDNFQNKTNMLINKLKEETNFGKKYYEDDIEEKFNLINELLQKETLDSLAGIQYINNLIRMFFSTDELKHFTYNYYKEKEGNRYGIVEVINYNENAKAKETDFDYENFEGINFIYRGKGLEEYSKRKTRKIKEASDKIDEEIIERNR